ncbi:uncharacterized protein [Chanodichthys erythropterus]|uniref:uncharacterized protein isoform X1 n=1 Tax=Chanodichthys erythropterus TaxID=933992 RepID=UPI00351EA185
MKKMFLRLVLFCSCLWRLVGGVDDAVEMILMEGDSVTLNSDLTEIKDDDQIQWMFGNTLIAEIYKRDDRFTVYDDVLDGRFRDKLKLDDQTGSLTITDTKTEHNGDYKMQTNSTRKRFSLTVTEFVGFLSVTEGDSVTLDSGLTEMKDDDQIQWMFGNTLIAEINKEFNRFTVYDDVLDGRFRDRLKLDNQTGSLTITNTTMKHTGVYKQKSNTVNHHLFLAVYGPYNDDFHFNFKCQTTLQITAWEISLKAFRVSVSDSVHCCGPTEAVIRLVLSALVGVATAIILVYDIRSRRAERDRAHIHTSEI